jgi:hypothetical protein
LGCNFSVVPRVIRPIDQSERAVLITAALTIAAWTTIVLGWVLFVQ